MYYFGALLIVLFPAWWLAAAISYFLEFYYLAAGFTLVGCASALVAFSVARPKFSDREKHQDISPEMEIENRQPEATEYDAVNT